MFFMYLYGATVKMCTWCSTYSYLLKNDSFSWPFEKNYKKTTYVPAMSVARTSGAQSLCS